MSFGDRCHFRFEMIWMAWNGMGLVSFGCPGPRTNKTNKYNKNNKKVKETS